MAKRQAQAVAKIKNVTRGYMDDVSYEPRVRCTFAPQSRRVRRSPGVFLQSSQRRARLLEARVSNDLWTPGVCLFAPIEATACSPQSRHDLKRENGTTET